MSGERWKEVTVASPCPACGRPDWCAWTPDSAMLKCERTSEPPCGMVLVKTQDSGGLFRRDDDGAACPVPVPRAKRPRPGKTGKVYKGPEEAFAAIARQVNGKLAGAWSYPDDVLRVGRFDLPEVDLDTGRPKKTFRPIRPVEGGWAIGDPPGLLPLYRGDELPDGGPVLVLEGERCADAARAVGLAAVTSAHGAKMAGKSDWSSLAGREVIILPDHDQPGQRYAQEIGTILAGLSQTATVKIVELPDLGERGDFADWSGPDGPMGCKTPEEIKAAVLDMAQTTTPCTPTTDGAGAAADAWPDPLAIPCALPPVKPFDEALLPQSLRPWVTDIAERMQCPPDFPAVGAMIGLAGVVGRKIGIRPKRRDDWLVVPNLWGAIIGRPSTMKSPPLREVMKPLKRLIAEADQRYQDELDGQAQRDAESKLRKAVLESQIKQAMKAGDDYDGLSAELAALRSAAPPVRKRYAVNDSTVEALGTILAGNPNGVMLLRDELIGLLKYLEREGQEAARAFYLEGWAGDGQHETDRIGRGNVRMEAVCLSLIGSIQPGPLGYYLRGAVEGGTGDDGLMQRLQLAVWPDDPGEWHNVDRWPDSEARTTAYQVFADLDAVTSEAAGAEPDRWEPDGVPFLRFDDAAQECFDAWRYERENALRRGDEHPAIEAHLTKYRSLIPTLALLIHLAEGQRGPVGPSALERAIGWGDYLATHARRIYATAIDLAIGSARALANHILAGDVADGFALRDVYRQGWSCLANKADAAEAVAYLIDLDWLREEVQPTAGRSRTVYWVNPKASAGESCDWGDRRSDRTDKSPESTSSVGSVGASAGTSRHSSPPPDAPSPAPERPGPAEAPTPRKPDPDRPSPTDLLTKDQYRRYRAVYDASEGEPTEKHAAAWRAALTGDTSAGLPGAAEVDPRQAEKKNLQNPMRTT